MKLRLLLGRMLVTKDPTVDSLRLKAGATLILPGTAHQLPTTALCLLHRATFRFGEDLTGQRVLIDKYAGRRFHLGGREFWIIPESACLAVLEGEE